MIYSLTTTIMILIWCVVFSGIATGILWFLHCRKGRSYRFLAIYLPAVILIPMTIVSFYEILGVSVIFPISLLTSMPVLMVYASVPAFILFVASGLLARIHKQIQEKSAFWQSKPLFHFSQSLGLDTHKQMMPLICGHSLMTAWRDSVPWFFSELIVVESLLNCPGLGLSLWLRAREQALDEVLWHLLLITAIYILVAGILKFINQWFGRKLEGVYLIRVSSYFWVVMIFGVASLGIVLYSEASLWQAATTPQLSERLKLPSLDAVLGTDYMGRDLGARLLLCLSTAVLPLWLVSLGASICGIALALLTIMMLHGETPQLVKYFFKALKSFSGILAQAPITIAVFFCGLILMETGLRSIMICLGICFTCQVQSLLYDIFPIAQNKAYWQAHQAMGGSLWQRLISYGLCREWRDSVAKALVFNMQIAIIIETSLSYLGFGIQEPQPSFGNILASHMEQSLAGNWYQVCLVLAAMSLVIYMPRLFFLGRCG